MPPIRAKLRAERNEEDAKAVSAPGQAVRKADFRTAWLAEAEEATLGQFGAMSFDIKGGGYVGLKRPSIAPIHPALRFVGWNCEQIGLSLGPFHTSRASPKMLWEGKARVVSSIGWKATHVAYLSARDGKPRIVAAGESVDPTDMAENWLLTFMAKEQVRDVPRLMAAPKSGAAECPTLPCSGFFWDGTGRLRNIFRANTTPKSRN